MHPAFQEFVLKLFDIAYLGHGNDCETPEMRVDYDWLGIGVAYDSYPGVSGELAEFIFELGAEISAFKIVD